MGLVKELFQKDNLNIKYFFKKNAHQFLYTPEDKKHSEILFVFNELENGIYEFHFKTLKSKGFTYHDDYQLTNEGNQYNVFAAMNNAIKKMDSYGMRVVCYDLSDEEHINEKRARVYNRIFANNGYIVTNEPLYSDEGVDYHYSYILYKKV